jgi:hypothetical protein
MMPRSLFRLATALVAVCAALATTAGAAFAEPVAIPGNPMTVYVGPQGQLQAYLSGAEDGIYYDPSQQLGDAGFFIAGREGPLGTKVWGFEGTAGPHGLEGYEAVSQGPVTGSGSAADPFSQVTEYRVPVGGGLRITETTTYVNGATEFRNKWVVTNEYGSSLYFRAFAAADFYFEGDDRGTGVFTQGPPRFIGGTNVDTGRSGGYVEVTGGSSLSPPWTHYQELAWPDIWESVIEKAGESATHFNDTVDPNDEDNAGGVEWDQYETTGLANGSSATYEVIARVAVPAALKLDPTNAGAPQGVPINITGTALDSVGQPYAGQALRYSISGVNPGSGVLTLNSSGQAVITDPGTNAGGDTISAFVDFNGNGVRDPDEPQASALATFVDSIPPSCKVTVKGDRPGGKGGAGNALVISVNCDETTSLTVHATLFLPTIQRHRKAHRSSAMSARKRGKGHGKKRHRIKLPKSTATIPPGADTPVKVKVPKGIARKYAGRKLTVKLVATVTDGSGNTTTVRKTSKVRIAQPKHKKHRRHHHKRHGGR